MSEPIREYCPNSPNSDVIEMRPDKVKQVFVAITEMKEKAQYGSITIHFQNGNLLKIEKRIVY